MVVIDRKVSANGWLVRRPRLWSLILQAATHTQSGCIGKVVASHVEGCRVDPRLRLNRITLCKNSQGVLPMRVGGATSELDLRSLTPLSVASCGRLQLGIHHWATPTSVDYCQKSIIDPTFCEKADSPLGGSWP